MAEAARRVPTLTRPTWITAERQTAPRGRRGRKWHQPKGHFAATYVMRPGGNAATAALRSFSSANALFEAIALDIDRERLALKWPNDVLLDQKKVAGILLEAFGPGGPRVEWLAIGFGVNLGEAPGHVPDADFEPGGLQGLIPREVLLSRLASNMATEEGIFDEMGFAPIREKWLRHAARLGEVITARTGREDVTGRFETVDEAGRLVLSTRSGERRIAAADVYF